MPSMRDAVRVYCSTPMVSAPSRTSSVVGPADASGDGNVLDPVPHPAASTRAATTTGPLECDGWRMQISLNDMSATPQC